MGRRKPTVNSPSVVNKIVLDNQLLIPFMLRKIAERGIRIDDYDSVLSDMNQALVRSAELYDSSKGYKVSTYITKSLWRTSLDGIRKRFAKRALTFRIGDDTDYDPAANEPVEDRSQEVHDMINSKRCNLTDREKYVLQEHRLQGVTLDSIGSVIGLTKERVRQIELAAIRKIRRAYKCAA